MKYLIAFCFVFLIAPVFAGQMYEWRDPVTGKLQLGDKPPNGIQYWKEGEKRPEEKAAEARENNKRKTEQERQAAIEQAERNKKALADIEIMKKQSEEIERIRKEKCTGDPDNIGAKIGMTSEIFRICFGIEPDTINTTITAEGTREQWVYHFSENQYRYFYFTNGILTAIQR